MTSHGTLFTRDVFHPGNPVLAEVVSESVGLASAKPKAVALLDAGRLLEAQPGLLERISAYAMRWRKTLDLRVSRAPAAILSSADFVILVGGRTSMESGALAAHRAALRAGAPVRQIRLPTTLRAQLGASDGLRSSHSPIESVICDPVLLLSQDAEGWRRGIAESLRAGLELSFEFFAWLEGHAEAIRARDLLDTQGLLQRHPLSESIESSLVSQLFERSRKQVAGESGTLATSIALAVIYAKRTGAMPITDALRALQLLSMLGFRATDPGFGRELRPFPPTRIPVKLGQLSSEPREIDLAKVIESAHELRSLETLAPALLPRRA